MRLPFGDSEFLHVFQRYNEAMWPAAIVLPALGCLCLVLLFREQAASRRTVLFITACLWAWTAIAYHVTFFSLINPVAPWFAGAALLQAALLIHAGLGDMRPARRDVGAAVGGAIMVFALAVYPALGYLAGHRYPAAPTFGLPCPTTIFTLGVLAWLRSEVSWRYAVIPLLWTVVGTSAALQLGMIEDLSLPAAAVAYVVAVAARGQRSSPGQVHATRGAR